MKYAVLLGVLVGMPLFCLSPRQQSQDQVDVKFCQPDVHSPYLAGNASFTIVYEFTLVNGSPQSVRRVSPAFGTDDETFKGCIQGWNIRGAADATTASAGFRWEHGTGWTRLEIASQTFKYVVSLTGNRCPYSR